MAAIKNNQPVKFDESVDLCNTDTTYYTQVVDNTDETQFQLGLTICSGQSQLIPDPNFSSSSYYVLGTNWAISSSQLCKTTGSLGTAFTNYDLPTTTGYYQINVTVDSISSGGSFDVYAGATLLGQITSTGNYTFYGFPSTIAFLGTPVGFVPSTSSDTICISSLTAFEVLTNFVIPIYDEDGNYVTQINYTDNPEYFSFVEDSLTVTIEWDALSVSNGCYYLCILDPCSNTNGQNYPANITNGTFTGSATGWTLASAWTYGANAVSATFSATPANNYLTQSNVFINYTTTYSVTVVITARTGNVLVYFGTTQVATLTTVGTHVVTGVPAGSFDLKLYISSGTATIDSVTTNEVSTSDYECDFTSNTFKLGDYSTTCPPTLLLNACNNENGLGFVFNGSGFSPRLRLQGKLRQSKYTSERIIEEDSDGKKNVIFYNRRKQKTLVADLLPEYIHDFLSTLVGYDKFYIDNIAYVVTDDEYNVTYDDSQDNVGSIALLVEEQTQLIRNVNCSSIENNCELPPSYLLQADDLTQNITLVNGELIIIN